MAEPPHSTFFDKAIAVTPIGPNTYSANIDPAWCIWKVPHGGYTTSILYRAAAVHFARKTDAHKKRGGSPEPIGFQISFLRRTFVGPAILTVQETKLGARVSTIHVSLSQRRDGPAAPNETGDASDLEVKVAAYITVSPPELEAGPIVNGTWGVSPPPPSGSLPDGSIDFKALGETGRDGAWVRDPPPHPALIVAKNLEIFSPASSSTKTLEEETKMVVDQWMRFTPGEKHARWSNEAVLFLADMFPAALNRMGAMEMSRLLALEGKDNSGKGTADAHEGRFWYPSVTVNYDLKTRLPPEGVEWLHSRVVTRMVRGSRADLDVLVLGQKGELVATSTQVALVVDAARNMKGRQDSGKL